MPLRVDDAVEQAVLAVRAEHPAWGGRKIHHRLLALGMAQPPAASTITAILRRHGQIAPLASRQRGPMQRFERAQPNELWQMDYKGAIRTAAGPCHPLTIVDDHSRYALAVVACRDEQATTVCAALTATMRIHGLPQRMLMDNGPCWGRVDAMWTRVEVWLLRLGVAVSHGRPYHPQTQGKNERFNQTLKAEALVGQNFANPAACQPRFDRFVHSYNHERPHEALGMATPASRYRASPFAFPETLGPIQYLADDLVRHVGEAGIIRLGGVQYQVGRAFSAQPVALRATAQDGRWAVFYCHQQIALIDQRERSCQPQR
jgi:transposase InsO family protein